MSRRYRLVCTIPGRRCHWRSRSWHGVSVWTFPPAAWDAAHAHARTAHGIDTDLATPIRTHFEVRRWRPWLRWAELAAVAAILLAGIVLIAVATDLKGWLR